VSAAIWRRNQSKESENAENAKAENRWHIAENI
jgi:hypothetical protein